MSILRRLRESRNYSESELAENIGVKTERVIEWEENSKEISNHELSSLAYWRIRRRLAGLWHLSCASAS